MVISRSIAAIKRDCEIVIRLLILFLKRPGILVGQIKKARTSAGAIKKATRLPRPTIASSSPLGMLALHLLEQWRQSGRDGIVFLAENENRAERSGSVLHSLDSSLDVLVFPRLNTLRVV
jgi:transcription-repair coupling factor (superfamily II helicase)